jgi:hypothetical protein
MSSSAEPWAGYDDQGELSIAYVLTEVSPETAQAVIAYESTHLERPTVIGAARERLL